MAVEAPHAEKIVIEVDIETSSAQTRGPRIKILDEQSRMRLASRAEVLFHPQVQLDAEAAEPAATTSGQHRRLGDLDEAEYADVESPQRVFAADRASQLHMVDHDASPPHNGEAQPDAATPPT